MKTRYTVALSMIAGAALGAVAIQGLNAQAQAKKVYLVSQADILDHAGVDAWNTSIRAAITKGGATSIFQSTKTIAVIGTAPQRVALTEFPSVEKAQAWLDSAERKAMAPQREKVVKFNQLFIAEGN